MRCVEEVKTFDGYKVFNFKNKGNKTIVAIDYEQEAKLSELQAAHAMQICPTGSILVKGKSFSKPFGDRQFDIIPEENMMPINGIKKQRATTKKKIVATTSLAGCFGCHMSFLDIDERLFDLIEIVEFDKSPIDDIKTFTRQCDIGLIEGGCCNDPLSLTAYAQAYRTWLAGWRAAHCDGVNCPTPPSPSRPDDCYFEVHCSTAGTCENTCRF